MCLHVNIMSTLPSIGHSASATVHRASSINRQLLVSQQNDKDISVAEANFSFPIQAVLKRVVPSPSRTFSQIPPLYCSLYNPI